MKSITPAGLGALSDGTGIVFGAVEISSTPPIRVWGGLKPVTFDGRTFQPVGDKSLVQVAGGALGNAAQSITLSLSGIDGETLALLDASEVSGAGVILWRLIYDKSGTQLLDFTVWARGRLDTLPTEDEIGGTATITARLETPARGLGRRGSRLRSDADQRLLDANDGFFKNVAYAAEKELYWGGPKPQRAGSVVNGGNSGRGGSGGGGPGRARDFRAF